VVAVSLKKNCRTGMSVVAALLTYT